MLSSARRLSVQEIRPHDNYPDAAGWLEAKEENASKLGTVLKFKYNSGTPKERVALVLPD